MTTPLPCPFCGSEATVIQRVDEYYVECTVIECCAIGDLFTRAEDAIEWWNRRAPTPRERELEARIAELEAQLAATQDDAGRELSKRDNRIFDLEAQLAEARKWVPRTDYGTGVVSYDPVVRDWSTPEEDEAWKGLEG